MDPQTKQHVPCRNTAIQFSKFPKTEVFETESAGFGLRLLEDVPPNTIIVEYVGEVITTEEMIGRMKKYKKSDHFYFATLGDGLMVDAGHMGSVARFANHSCQPNCSLQRWNVKNESRIALVSKDFIPADTEITYQYNFTDDGWRNNPIRGQKCYCQSIFCNGYVGASQKNSFQDIQHQESKSKHIISVLLQEKNESKKSKETIRALLEQNEEILGKFSVREMVSKNTQSSSDNNNQQEIAVMESLLTTTENVQKVYNEYLNVEKEIKSFLKNNRGFLSVDNVCEMREKISNFQISSDLENELETICSDYQKAMKLVKRLREDCGLDASEIILIQEVEKGDEREESESDSIEENAKTDAEITSTPSATIENPQRGLLPSFSPDSKGFILWDNYLVALASTVKCFPLRCPYSSWLMNLYLETTSFIVSSLLPLVMNTDYYYEADNEVYQKEYQIVSDFFRLYEEKDDKKITVLPNDIFYITNYLNQYLSTYMEKNFLDFDTSSTSTKTKKEITDSLTTQLTPEQLQRSQLGKRKGLKLPETALIEKKSDNQLKKLSKELHCYCRLKEEDGENHVMAQCNSCDGWFHLTCSNYPTATTTSVKGMNEFHCNSCLFKVSKWNLFAFEPQTEWKYFKKDLSSAAAVKEFQKRTNKLSSSSLVNQPPVDLSFSEHPSTALTPGSHQVSKDILELQKTFESLQTLKGKKKSTNFLTLEEFEKILKHSEQTIVQWVSYFFF
jgi:uncharacterized protein YsxB (DUF464 family)